MLMRWALASIRDYFADDFEGVAINSIARYPKMEMRPGYGTGVADTADHLSLVNTLAALHAHSTEVEIIRIVAASMRDHYIVPE